MAVIEPPLAQQPALHEAPAVPTVPQLQSPAAPPRVERLDFAFEPVGNTAPLWPAEPTQPDRWPVFAGGAVMVLALAAAVAWYTLGRAPAVADGAKPGVAAPAVVPDVVAPPSAAVSDTAQARPEPVEEFIDPERIHPTPVPSVAAAPAAAAPPAPEAPFTPVTAPRGPDAAPPQPGAARPRVAAAPADASWPPVARPAPGDGLAALRQGLAQCAAMANELSRNTCLARTRQNFCGNAWGRIPECPPGQ